MADQANGVDSEPIVNALSPLDALVSYLGHSDDLLQQLRTWLANVDPQAYQQALPWSPEMLQAYNDYKAADNAHGAAHQAFQAHRAGLRRITQLNSTTSADTWRYSGGTQLYCKT